MKKKKPHCWVGFLFLENLEVFLGDVDAGLDESAIDRFGEFGGEFFPI